MRSHGAARRGGRETIYGEDERDPRMPARVRRCDTLLYGPRGQNPPHGPDRPARKHGGSLADGSGAFPGGRCSSGAPAARYRSRVPDSAGVVRARGRRPLSGPRRDDRPAVRRAGRHRTRRRHRRGDVCRSGAVAGGADAFSRSPRRPSVAGGGGVAADFETVRRGFPVRRAGPSECFGRRPGARTGTLQTMSST